MYFIVSGSKFMISLILNCLSVYQHGVELHVGSAKLVEATRLNETVIHNNHTS